MSTPASRHRAMRAGDTDRIQIAQLLTDAAASGTLQLGDYEDRADQGVRRPDPRRARPVVGGSARRGDARSQRSVPAGSADVAAGNSEWLRTSWPLECATAADHRRLLGWARVDLRYADFTSHDVEIRSYSIMGGQTILVPPEVNVDLHGVAVMGSFDQTVSGEAHPARPVSASAASRCGAASGSNARSARSRPTQPEPASDAVWRPGSRRPPRRPVRRGRAPPPGHPPGGRPGR